MLQTLFWNKNQNRLRAIWRLVLFLLIVAIVANPIVLLLDTTDNAFLEGVLVNPIAAIAFFVAIWISAKYLDKRPLKDFGLKIDWYWWRDFGVGFLIGAIMVSLMALLFFAMGWIEVKGHFYTIFNVSFAVAFLGQLLRYAAGSFFEELFSRSYLLRMVAETLNYYGINPRNSLLISWLGTSLIFGGLHLFNPNSSMLGAINISLYGLLFGVGVIYTGRLGLPIGMHMAWNVFQNNVFGMPNSGKPSNTTFLETVVDGPAIWTGGPFGAEGSLLGFIIVAIGFLLLWWWLRKIHDTPALQLSLSIPPETNKAIS